MIRSTSFLAFYGTFFAVGTCSFRNFFKNDHWRNIFGAGAICGLSLLAEQPQKRDEVVNYCLPRLLEILYNGGVKRKWLVYVPYGEVCLFSMAVSMLMYQHQHYPKFLNFLVTKSIEIFFGVN